MTPPRISYILLILTLSICGAGCAFGTRQVTLTYPPISGSKTDASVAEAALPPKESNGAKVAVATLRDERSNKTTIGEVRNGFAMKTSDAVAQNDVAEWVTNAIIYELQAEGFDVVTNDADFGSAAAIVSGELITVYCTALFAYEGEVSFYGTIAQNGQEVLRNRYTAQGTAGMNWAATSVSYGKSLGDALQKAAKAFVIDIKQKTLKPSLQVAATEKTSPLEPLADTEAPKSTEPSQVRVETSPNSLNAIAELPKQTLTPPAKTAPSLGYGYLQWEYSDTSKGNFPLEVVIENLKKKETLSRGERAVTKANAGSYTVVITDPDTSAKSKPNWSPYEIQLDVEDSGYTRLVFETDPKGKNGVISISVFNDDKLNQQRFVVAK